MDVPPVPPRPFSDYDDYRRRPSDSPPPVPPLPEQFNRADASSGPHFEDPLVAPRPHKLQPDLPASMARTLDEQSYRADPYASRPQPAAYNTTPGFAVPPAGFSSPQPQPQPHPSRHASPLPAPQGSDWSPWAGVPQQQYAQQQYPPQQPRHADSLAPSFANMSLAGPPPLQQQQYSRGGSFAVSATPPQIPASMQQQPGPGAPPSLTAPLPTIPALSAALSGFQHLDPPRKVAWCRDVLSLVDRAQQLIVNDPSTAQSPVGPAKIVDPELQRLVGVALPTILQLSQQQSQQPSMPLHIAEIVFLLGTCEASGAYPQFVQHNPRAAFRHYEQAAKAGHHMAWFKLGRDYENFGDAAHAKQCFERGVKYGVESCLYRMGMANLMGQLGLPANTDAALPLLNRAATLSSLDVPQPAYVYGLLLLNEFSHVTVPPQSFQPYIPPGSSAPMEARKHLERAAYLNFAPAQYKLGHAYEFAMHPFPFDALLSVQYYSLASQQGEIEADMALSKWFLCGSEGAFEKDEVLAWTFAEKAAGKGLPSAEFAMGYYAEVGVGGPKDIETAIKWYGRASEHGNTDAAERLQALSSPSPLALSREQHEQLTDNKLVRKRTQAKQRSDATRSGGARQPATLTESQQIVNNVRGTSKMGARAPSGSLPPSAAGGHGYNGPPNPAYGLPQGPSPHQSPPQMGRHPNLPPTDDGRRHRHTNSIPSAGPVAPNGAPGGYVGPATGPGPAAQRAFAGAQRYTLTDPGSGSRSASPSRSPAPLRPRQSRVPTGDGPLPMAEPLEDSPPQKRGPQTFEEMGFHSQKLEEKECRIM